ELAFPVTAAVIGVGLLGVRLTWTQWLGFAIVVVSVTTLAWHERVRPDRQLVVVPPAADRVAVGVTAWPGWAPATGSRTRSACMSPNAAAGAPGFGCGSAPTWSTGTASRTAATCSCLPTPHSPTRATATAR